MYLLKAGNKSIAAVRFKQLAAVHNFYELASISGYS